MRAWISPLTSNLKLPSALPMKNPSCQPAVNGAPCRLERVSESARTSFTNSRISCARCWVSHLSPFSLRSAAISASWRVSIVEILLSSCSILLIAFLSRSLSSSTAYALKERTVASAIMLATVDFVALETEFIAQRIIKFQNNNCSWILATTCPVALEF